MRTQNPYALKKAVLTSKHKKLPLIEIPFRESLSIEVVELPLDTDMLGTFSGEVKRTSTPIETAVKKARLGMQATGLPLGIASEGSIAPNPNVPWIQSDLEIMVFVDSDRDLVITESFLSHDIVATSIEITPGDQIDDFLQKSDFPRHALIVHPVQPVTPLYRKGITSLSELHKAIDECAHYSAISKVRIESDLRAMHSPSRQLNIEKTAQLLAARVAALCPSCSTPGWGRTGYEYGVECSLCGELNKQIAKSEIVSCLKCDLRQSGRIINESIDPARCNLCNP